MNYWRLTNKHPAFQRLQFVFDKMEEEGVTIDIGRYGDMVVTVEGHGEFQLLDLEADPEDMAGRAVSRLPPGLEYKMLDAREEE